MASLNIAVLKVTSFDASNWIL